MFKLSPGERDLVRQTLVVWLVIVILNYHLMLIDTWVPVLGGLAVWGVTLLFGSLFGLALVGRLLWGRRWLPAAIACVSMAAASAVLVLDGAVGYAYLPDPPPRGTAFDGFGDAVFVCRSLGSDWYWVTRRGGSC